MCKRESVLTVIMITYCYLLFNYFVRGLICPGAELEAVHAVQHRLNWMGGSVRRLPACWDACLPACLFVCLFVCLSLCLPAYLSICRFVCLSVYLFDRLSICLSVSVSVCVFVYNAQNTRDYA